MAMLGGDPQTVDVQPVPVGFPDEASNEAAGVVSRENEKGTKVCFVDNGRIEAANLALNPRRIELASRFLCDFEARHRSGAA
jgi:hypothetical protein